MLMPKRLKYRKVFKGRIKGKASKGNKIEFGEYGLQAMSKGKITSRQIEAARIAITRYVRRGGKLIIRIFPHKPVTKKPAETRMGKGKGAVEYYVAPVKEGTMLYEISGVTEAQAREAFRLASHKLPVKCRFVKKSDFEKEEK
ncbi:50S ribosomal protein L16 [Deferribacter thermophilus]|uniref:50S ribosomal protein L16 n=1 Tax=Deferribacter thermophilus TaxID=53573 RepID=UPI003C209CF7